MSQNVSILHMQLAPIPARGHVSDEITSLRVACSSIVSRPRWLRQRRVDDAFPRKQGKEFFIPSSACGGGPGWGLIRTPVTLDFAFSSPPINMWRSERAVVRADEVIQ